MMSTFSVDENTITACFDDDSRWVIPLTNIAVIGEYTTEDGPGADDYFVCIIDKDGRMYHIGSEEGAFDLIKKISSSLGSEMNPQLILSTRYASRILYPPQVVGKPFYNIIEYQPKSLVDRVKYFFLKGMNSN